ncbi:MAG: OmpA family protein, partial [Gammaproteobacteria bacterium]
ILNKSSNDSALGGVFNMLNNKGNANVLDNLGSLVGGGNLAQGDPKDLAGDFMGKLFGNKVGGILDLVTSASGLKKSSSSSVLGLVGPLVMGYLSRRIFKGGLNASGLVSMLLGQKDNIAKALPSGMGSMVGLADLNQTERTTSAATSHTNYTDTNTKYAEPESSSKLMPIILGLAGLGALFFGLKNCSNTDMNTNHETVGEISSEISTNTGNKVSDAAGQLSHDVSGTLEQAKGAITSSTETVNNAVDAAIDGASAVANEAGDTATAMVDSAGDMASAASDAMDSATSAAGDAASSVAAGIGGFFSRTLGSGKELNIPESGIENNLINFLDDANRGVDSATWFNFDRINFATGSSTLDMNNSSEQLENMAAILQAYPAVALKIGGYTDNTGSIGQNMKISTARANAVMHALTGMGIDGSRLAAEGYGPAHPVASNDTTEGRAQNRRIAIRVTNK